jgi:hypothetical protein
MNTLPEISKWRTEGDKRLHDFFPSNDSEYERILRVLNKMKKNYPKYSIIKGEEKITICQAI